MTSKQRDIRTQSGDLDAVGGDLLGQFLPATIRLPIRGEEKAPFWTQITLVQKQSWAFTQSPRKDILKPFSFQRSSILKPE